MTDQNFLRIAETTIISKTTMKIVLMNFYLFLILLAFSEARHKSYGGKYVRGGQFPFVALISYKGSGICGASIIHERWILTAAHCLHDDESKISVTVGTVDKFGSGITYDVKNFHAHPDFIVIPEGESNELEYVVNDIGLIRLASNITFNDKIQPITLATDEDGSYENTMASLPGWGADVYYKGLHQHLRYINVRVLTDKECQRVWTYADKHICTSNQEQQGGCYGDSGSPLVVGGKQIGITSTGDMYCDSQKPDLYTKVTSFIPWIKSIMSRYGDALRDF